MKNLYHLIMAVLANLYFGFPSRKLKVIGVTGTDGKTTTCHLIYELLRGAGKKVALISTVEARIGEESIDTGFHVTSPDSWDLQRLLSKAIKTGHEYVVLEATSHGLAQHRLWGVNFSMAVLTNITHEHLDYHKTPEAYFEAKATLFRHTPVCVLNSEDDSYERLLGVIKEIEGIKKIGYGLKAGDVHPEAVKYTTKGQEISIWGVSFSVPLLGDYNTANILAALAVGHELGLSPHEMSVALNNFKGIPGRFELIDEGQSFTVVVDFAHTPNALQKMLKNARLLLTPDHKLIVVFGCAGLRDVEKRYLMGEIAVKYADRSVFTAEDPRTEDVHAIIAEIVRGAKVAGGVENDTYFIRPDRREALEFALKSLASPGDLVVITGKGHEKTMCIGTEERDWSDQATVKEILRESSRNY